MKENESNGFAPYVIAMEINWLNKANVHLSKLSNFTYGVEVENYKFVVEREHFMDNGGISR